MATSSIFANVVVNSEEAAKKIVAAYESCEASNEKPFYKTSFTDRQERAIELIKTQVVWGKKMIQTDVLNLCELLEEVDEVVSNSMQTP